MKLSIRSVILWEQLNNNPFSNLDYNNEDDLLSILYVCSLSENNRITFNDFNKQLIENNKRTFFDKLLRRKKQDTLKMLLDEYQNEVLFLSQFQHKEKEKEIQEDGRPSKIFIKDIVSMLIMNGLDAHFAFNEMSLSDLPLLVEAYDNERKIRLEYDRLWTFFNVSPYLRKGSTPNSLFPFDWEKKDEPEIKKNTLEEDIALYEAFMNSGKELNKNE